MPKWGSAHSHLGSDSLFLNSNLVSHSPIRKKMELLRSVLHWQKPDQKVHPISGTNSPIWGAEGVLSCLLTFAGVRVQISQAMCVCGSLSERLMCYGRGHQGHDRHRGGSHSLVENYGMRSFEMLPVQDYVCVHMSVSM